MAGLKYNNILQQSSEKNNFSLADSSVVSKGNYASLCIELFSQAARKQIQHNQCCPIHKQMTLLNLVGCFHTCLIKFSWITLEFFGPLGVVRLGRCECSNRTRVCTKNGPHKSTETSLKRWTRPNCKQTLERFAHGEKEIRPNGLTNQAVS